ncbi:unnamed protein product, partial [Timema podura]|nr:unnamed protein product [Timema podura]
MALMAECQKKVQVKFHRNIIRKKLQAYGIRKAVRMNHVENQALELLRRRDWSRAAELFDQLLGPALGNDVSQEKLITLLLGRSECCSELGHHDVVVSDCRRIIKLHGVGNHGGRARRRLVHALFSMRRFAEAEAAAREWLITGRGDCGLGASLNHLSEAWPKLQSSVRGLAQ